MWYIAATIAAAFTTLWLTAELGWHLILTSLDEDSDLDW